MYMYTHGMYDYTCDVGVVHVLLARQSMIVCWFIRLQMSWSRNWLITTDQMGHHRKWALVNCYFTSKYWLMMLDSLLQQIDQKNIRRRVYDALNVLMAMNIISKEKKEIRWIGLPTNSVQECEHIQVWHSVVWAHTGVAQCTCIVSAHASMVQCSVSTYMYRYVSV